MSNDYITTVEYVAAVQAALDGLKDGDYTACVVSAIPSGDTITCEVSYTYYGKGPLSKWIYQHVILPPTGSQIVAIPRSHE